MVTILNGISVNCIHPAAIYTKSERYRYLSCNYRWL